MRKNHKWSILIALVLAGIAGVAWASFPPLGTSQDVQYYSDSAQTDLIGGWRVNCDGSQQRWGTQHGYPQVNRVKCPTR